MTTDASATVDARPLGGRSPEPPRRSRSWVTVAVLSGALVAALVVILGSGDQLIASLGAAFQSPVTIIVVAAVVILGGVGAYAQRTGKRASEVVEGTAAKLRSMQATEDREHGIEFSKLNDARKLMASMGPAGTLFREQWEEFEESLVTRRGRYFNTMEAGRFFTDADFESSVRTTWLGISYSFIHELPGFMTSLGMLGTFVGIALGLGELGGDKSQIVDHLGGVITGLASAFWTSIFGLMGAAMTIYLNHKTDAHCVSAMGEFRLALDRLIPRATSEYYLEQQGNQLVLLGELQADAVHLAKSLPEIRHGQELANQYLHTMANDIAEGTGKVILGTLEPLLQRVADIVQNQVQHAAEQSQGVIAEMAGALTSEFRNALEGSVAKIGEQTEAMVSSFERVTASLDDHVGNAVSSLTSGFEEATTALAGSFSSAGGALEQSASRASESLDSAARGMSTALESAGEGLSKALSTAVDGAKDGLVDIADSMVVAMRDAASTMETELKTAIAPLVTALRALNTLTNNMSELTKVQEELLERHMTVSRELKGAATELTPALHALRQHDQVLGTTLESIQRFLKDLEATHSALIETSADLRSGLNETSANLAGSVTALSAMTREFSGWTQTTSSSIQQFADSMSGSVKTTLKEYDSALVMAVGRLASAGQGLVAVAEKISEKANLIVRAS